MIVTPGRDRGANEDAVDEEGGRHLLRPQQGMAGDSCQNVKQRRRGEASQTDAAELHQNPLEWVQRPPFEAPIGVEDEVRAAVHRYWIERQT